MSSAPAMPSAPPYRLPGWPQRLGELVTQRLAVPFAWGSNDCAAWLADAVAVQHGRDTLAELRGVRASWLQARRQIRRGGGYPAAMARAGLQAVPPALAQRGDAVLLEQPGTWPVLAVCMGADALAPGADGLQAVPMAQAVAAWRV